MTATVFENHNIHPVTGNWIEYLYKKGEEVVMVCLDDMQGWIEVPLQTSINNESDFARWIYGFKAGLAVGLSLK